MSDTLNNNILSSVGNSGKINANCIAADAFSDEQKNLNNNNSKKYTTSNSTNRNDEIIEEGFDYSDTDLLDELNASDDNDNDNDNSCKIADGERIVHSRNDNDQHLPSAQDMLNKVEADVPNITGISSLLDDTATDTNSHDNKRQSSAAENVFVDSAGAPIMSTDNATNTAVCGDKQKLTLTNLVLRAENDGKNHDCETSTAEGAVDSYCPITPRRIVDVESQPTPLLRSSSTKRIENSNKNDVDAADVDSTSKDLSDEGYYYADEPEDELIVQFLGEANRIAEARLAARRQARAEAREIRMRELERQQKEQEQNADRVFDMHTSSSIDPLSRSRLATGVGSSPLGAVLNSARANSMSSRRSSEDSLEEEGRSLRDIRHELKDVEDRFRKAMIANAQLDNERASQTYQIQLLKDKLEEVEESYAQLQREFKDKSRDCNALKRNLDKLNEELKLVQGQLTERDKLIAEQGLVIVAIENEEGTDAKRALVSVENAQLLGSVQGSLDVRLKKFSEEKQQLLGEVQKLQETVENFKSQGKGRSNSLNGPTGSDEDYEAQREANKIISEYKYKLQKAEQEIASLQASLARSETQVIRYKSTAEAAEKAEAELKIERRKLQREELLVIHFWDECHCQ
ncbi:leucine-rich repeat flightless-interacting protein 2 isoform X2 [Ceratitis capitata]|uniref:leucine-rich repeat flightless-interacting protein 2 isoform X2 n=1 Tax=Ceratitis capitata TaxID=7213 RepID=UPI000A0FB446|nr:leucine-rich repeat flightless-interacting protein 2 isoform X2 [Ceratitis capitata]